MPVDPDTEPGALLVQDSGMVPVSTQISIVNPETNQLCLVGEYGEIWVQSEANAHSFYGSKERLDAERFNGRTVDGDPNVRYVRTGDLGFLHNVTRPIGPNGAPVDMQVLFVLGSIGDTFEVNGLNHFSMDIEQSVERCHRNIVPGGWYVPLELSSHFTHTDSLQRGLPSRWPRGYRRGNFPSQLPRQHGARHRKRHLERTSTRHRYRIFRTKRRLPPIQARRETKRQDPSWLGDEENAHNCAIQYPRSQRLGCANDQRRARCRSRQYERKYAWHGPDGTSEYESKFHTNTKFARHDSNDEQPFAVTTAATAVNKPWYDPTTRPTIFRIHTKHPGKPTRRPVPRCRTPRPQRPHPNRQPHVLPPQPTTPRRWGNGLFTPRPSRTFPRKRTPAPAWKLPKRIPSPTATIRV